MFENLYRYNKLQFLVLLLLHLRCWVVSSLVFNVMFCRKIVYAVVHCGGGASKFLSHALNFTLYILLNLH